MKGKLLLFFLFSLFYLLSCNKRYKDVDDLSPLVIYGSSQYGYAPSGAYTVSGQMWDKTTNTLSFSVVPSAFMSSPAGGAITDALYQSIRNGELEKRATEAEAFAYERIMERTRQIRERYVLYRDQWAQSKGMDPREARLLHAAFVYAYSQGVPSITADGELFGQPAGTDLSGWFWFNDANIIRVTGMDHVMTAKGEENQTAAEYFTQDRMLPLTLCVGIPDLPEDITYTGRVTGADVVTVTISIPVRFERYWEWCKELFTNPEATEEFTSTNIRFTLPFVCK